MSWLRKSAISRLICRVILVVLFAAASEAMLDRVHQHDLDAAHVVNDDAKEGQGAFAGCAHCWHASNVIPVVYLPNTTARSARLGVNIDNETPIANSGRSPPTPPPIT
jgi:hypothetical protein